MRTYYDKIWISFVLFCLEVFRIITMEFTLLSSLAKNKGSVDCCIIKDKVEILLIDSFSQIDINQARSNIIKIFSFDLERFQEKCVVFRALL